MMHPPLPDEVLIRAALLGVFDPRDLLDGARDSPAQELAALATLSAETAFGPLWLWTLGEDARRDGLTLLPPPGPARRAQLADVRPRDGDELGRAILDLLAPKPRADLRRLLDGQGAGLPDERLIALFKMLELIGSTGIELPDWLAGGDARRRLQHAIMQRRAEKASQAVLPDRFRGRRRELASLRDFALSGALPRPGTGAVRRLAEKTSDGVPALLVSGIGGTGKSALIEQLRRNLQGSDRVVLAQFDLDRTALRLGDQLALLQELLRQIGFALPALDARVATLRDEIRNAMALSLRPIDLEAGASAIFGAMSGLNALLAETGMNARALIIIVDTFEEALQLGPQRIAQIAGWLCTLCDHGGFASLRVILSGRSAETLTDMPQDLATLGVIELDELGSRAGRAKLRDMFRRLRIAHEDLIPDLIAEFGSNPLVIEILAVYCSDKPRDDITGLMRGSDAHARSALSAEMRQRFLYSRILERLTDPELKPLACPGLILRRIEPAQITGLLAGPCGLPLPMTPERVQALFDRLATHLWLVRRVGPDGNVLEHLPDLRRLMLPQILADPAARAVARAAAGWFTSGPGADQPGAAFDALYYAILAEDAELPEDAARLHDFALHLGAAAGDLPASTQARLREAQGHVLRRDEIAHLQGPARDRAIKKRRETQRTHGLETSVVAEQLSMAETGTEAAGETAESSAALVQSLFAAGEFHQLAEAALPLAQDLFDGILTGNLDQTASEPLQHPAYLAALALAVDGDQLRAFGADLAAWLKAADLMRALHKPAAFAPETHPGGSPLEIALMVLAVSGQLDMPHGLELSRICNDMLPPSFVAHSPVQWRVCLVRARMAGHMASVMLPVMPVLAPALLRQITGGKDAGMDVAIGDIQRKRMRDLQQTSQPMTLRDLTGIEKTLTGMVLHLRPEAAIRDDLRPIIPGRQPEFHAPLRVLLTEGDASAHLPEAIAPFAEIPWWPQELRPEAFTTRHNSTQTLALIDMLDKFGGLTAFAASLANAPDATPRLTQLHRIMARAEAAWADTLIQTAAQTVAQT